MNLVVYIANLLFRLLNRQSYQALSAACSDPETTQKKTLLSILRKNEETEYGSKYSFRHIKTIDDFQKQVPVTSYDDYLEYIQRIMEGQNNILSRAEVQYFGLSSGSSSASKYIPYTSSLKKEFSRALNPWIYDLLKNYPLLRRGKQFWIVTPGTLPDYLPSSKIPIGFEEDEEYFRGPGKFLIKSVLCLPGTLAHSRNQENYFYMLSWCMLCEKNLRLISVWNPGLLVQIMHFMAKHFHTLCDDIARGKPHLPRPEISHDRALAESLPPGKPHRGKWLSDLGRLSPSTTLLIWPRLCLISCWNDAWAATLTEEVKNLFPGVEIQGKGLMATEGVVSIPLKKVNEPLLTINAQFYEFQSLKDNKIYLAHQLSKDEDYELILTGSGGFYRYRLNDIIRVKGFYRKTPLIRFIGKTDRVSDLCGEKLHEVFVIGVISKIRHDYELGETYICLAPGREKQFRYTFFFKAEESGDASIYQKIIDDLDQALMENYHYKHCRNMHQLDAPVLVLLNSEEALEHQRQRSGKNISSTRKYAILEKELMDTEKYKQVIHRKE